MNFIDNKLEKEKDVKDTLQFIDMAKTIIPAIIDYDYENAETGERGRFILDIDTLNAQIDSVSVMIKNIVKRLLEISSRKSYTLRAREGDTIQIVLTNSHDLEIAGILSDLRTLEIHTPADEKIILIRNGVASELKAMTLDADIGSLRDKPVEVDLNTIALACLEDKQEPSTMNAMDITDAPPVTKADTVVMNGSSETPTTIGTPGPKKPMTVKEHQNSQGMHPTAPDTASAAEQMLEERKRRAIGRPSIFGPRKKSR